MLYENYQKKLKRIATGISIVVKTMPIILLSIAVLAVIATSLVVAKGSVGSVNCPDELVYGEELDCKAFGMLTKVTFEYCKVGEDEWTTEIPREQGEYQVRAVGNTSFGAKRYGNVKTVTILPKQIEVSVLEKSIVYGETPTPSADILAGESIVCESFTFDDVTATKTNITPDQGSIKIITEDGKDVTDCYTVIAVARSVDILARPISITVEDYTAIYNGKECSFDIYEISDGSLKSGDILSASFSDKLIEAGSVENAPSFKVLNNDGNDVTHLYAMSIRNGHITVEKRPLIITTNGFEESYTGEAQYLSSYVTNEETPLAEGHRIVTASYSKFTDAGEYTNAMAFRVLDARGADVSDNYALTVVEGSVTIKRKKITVTTPSEEWTYDGTAHYNIDFVIDGLVEGHRAVASAKFPSLTDAGSAKNEFEIVIYSGSYLEYSSSSIVYPSYGEDFENDPAINTDDVIYPLVNVMENYEIKYVYGTIEVKKRSITIKPEDVEKVYDGTAHSPQSIILAESSANALTDGCFISGQMTGERLDVGHSSSDVVLESVKITVFNNMVGTQDLTDNYEIKTEKGSIDISVRELVLKTKSEKFMYDGKSHSSLELEDGFVPNLAEGDVLTVVSGPSVTNVADGEIINEFSEVTIKSADGKSDRYGNYKITYDSGLISVYPRTVTIKTEANENAIYNGKKQYFTAVTVAGNGLAEGQTISVIKSTEFEDAIEKSAINEVLDFKIYFENDATETDIKSGNYEWTFDLGRVRINKRAVKITTPGQAWDYDGESHSFTEGVRVDNLSENHYFGIVDYPSVTDYQAVAVKNKIAIRIYTNIDGETVDKTANYEISEASVYGDLVINRLPLTITTLGKTWEYDGFEHFYIESDYEDVVQVVGLLANSSHEYRISGYPVIKNVKDSCKNKVEIKVFETVDGKKIDKTHNYYVSDASVYGDLVLEKRVIKIRTQKELDAIYNGEVRQFTDFEILVGGEYTSLAPDQIFEVKRTTPFEDVMFDEDGETVISAYNEILEFIIYYEGDIEKNDLSANYTVEWDKQEVKISPRVVTVSTQDASWIYDGKSHSCSTDGSLLSVGNLASDHKFKITQCATVKDYTLNPIENSVIIEIYKTEGNQNIDKTKNYIFDESFGTLEVTKRNIIVATETNRDTVYDGKAHTFTDPDSIFWVIDGIVVNDQGLAENHRFVVENGSSTSIKYVTEGELDNIYSDYKIVDAKGEEATDNYVIVEWQYGKIELQKRTVIIKTGTLTHDYDATEVSCTEWQYSTYNKYKFVDGDSFKVTNSTTVKNVNRATASDRVGYYDNLFEEYTVTDKSGIDRLGNYDIQYDENCGTITVNPRPITVTSKGATIEYNGEELTKSEYELSGGLGLVADHVILAEYSGSQLYAGESNNLFEIFISGAEGSVTRNYEISYEYGRLKVTPVPITLAIIRVSVPYDGQQHFVSLSGKRQSRSDVTVSSAWLNLSQTVPGTITVWDVRSTVDNIECDVTKVIDGNTITVPMGSYEITLQDFGSQEAVVVSRRTIIIKAKDADKIYNSEDAYPLENHEYILSGAGLLAGHRITSIKFDETSSVVGNDKTITYAENIIVYGSVVIQGPQGDVTDYYDIQLVSGTLTYYPNDNHLKEQDKG